MLVDLLDKAQVRKVFHVCFLWLKGWENKMLFKMSMNKIDILVFAIFLIYFSGKFVLQWLYNRWVERLQKVFKHWLWSEICAVATYTSRECHLKFNKINTCSQFPGKDLSLNTPHCNRITYTVTASPISRLNPMTQIILYLYLSWTNSVNAWIDIGFSRCD